MTVSIDRALAQQVREEIEAAALPILAKHGLERRKSGATYGTDEITVRISAITVNLNENGVNTAGPEAESYRMFAKSYGLPEDGLGRTFAYKGRTYTVTGLKYRSKMPVAAKRDDGKTFKFGAGFAAGLLAASR